MSTSSTSSPQPAPESRRLTSAQRAQLAVAGRKHAAASDKAHKAFDRAIAGPKRRHDEAITKADAEYDATVAAILGVHSA